MSEWFPKSVMCFFGWFPTHLDSGWFSAACLKDHLLEAYFLSSRLVEDSGAVDRQNHCLHLAKRLWWFYNILGTSHPWSRNWGSESGTSFVFSLLFWRSSARSMFLLGGRHLQKGLSELRCYIFNFGICVFFISI